MLVRERLERENPENIAILNSVQDSDLVCIRGTLDHIHLYQAKMKSCAFLFFWLCGTVVSLYKNGSSHLCMP